MATRGAVAVKTGSLQFRGVYNHSDSYPTGLGKELWDYLRQGEVDLERFCKELLKYGEWREYVNRGRCQYCGKVGVGQACNINGRIFGLGEDDRKRFRVEIEPDADILENIKKFGYPDPEGKWHQHDKREADIFSKDAKYNGLYIEWVYVVDFVLRRIEIYTSVRDKGFHWEKSAKGKRFKVNNYQYVIVRVVDIDGEEPDWREIEREGDKMAERAYNYYEKMEKMGKVKKI